MYYLTSRDFANAANTKETTNTAMYYLTSRDFANAAIDAYNRGVKIRAYLDKDQRQAKYSKSCYLTTKIALECIQQTLEMIDVLYHLS